MSSYIQNSKLKNIAKNSLKRTIKSKNPPTPSVNLRYSNDGKAMEVAVSYYFNLTKKENL